VLRIKVVDEMLWELSVNTLSPKENRA